MGRHTVRKKTGSHRNEGGTGESFDFYGLARVETWETSEGLEQSLGIK